MENKFALNDAELDNVVGGFSITNPFTGESFSINAAQMHTALLTKDPMILGLTVLLTPDQKAQIEEEYYGTGGYRDPLLPWHTALPERFQQK